MYDNTENKIDYKMKNLQNLEIINISTKKGKLVAIVSFQDASKIGEDLNNGYDTIKIPINIREIQTSVRGNMLVNQSITLESSIHNK